MLVTGPVNGLEMVQLFALCTHFDAFPRAEPALRMHRACIFSMTLRGNKHLWILSFSWPPRGLAFDLTWI